MIEACVTATACVAAMWFGFRHGRRWPMVLCVVGLTLVVVKAALSRRPDLEARFLVWSDYALIEPYWPYPVGFLLIGLGLWKARDSLPRRCVMYAGLVALAVPLGLLVHGAFDVDPTQLVGVPDVDGVCLQSTPYSCAPAAAASYLAGRGIPTTEREMAALSRTNAVYGTSEFGLMAALRRKGLKPRIGCGVLAVPCLVVVEHSAWVDHCVVVTAADDRQVCLIDPLIGRVVEDRGLFDRRWRGVAIWSD